MRARQFVLRMHYSMYRRCPQRWRIATVATDTPPNLLPVQGLYSAGSAAAQEDGSTPLPFNKRLEVNLRRRSSALRKKEMVELRRCLLSIEPPRSKRRRPGAVSCAGRVKSTPLLRQTASVVARLAI